MSSENLKTQRGKDLYQSDASRFIVLKSQTEVFDLIYRISKFFFEHKAKTNRPPFRGFLLTGLPGTGKTELVKRLVFELDKDPWLEFHLLFIDGSNIAAPKWGEAEKRLQSVFRKAEAFQKNSDTRSRLIILFDDIESLLLGRSVHIAKEWHFSINSIFFHEMDNINSDNCIVFATTNRNDLVDSAILNRMYSIEISPPTLEELMRIANKSLGYGDPESKKILLKKIESNLQEISNPTIRDIEQLVIVNAIKSGYWG